MNRNTIAVFRGMFGNCRDGRLWVFSSTYELERLRISKSKFPDCLVEYHICLLFRHSTEEDSLIRRGTYGSHEDIQLAWTHLENRCELPHRVPDKSNIRRASSLLFPWHLWFCSAAVALHFKASARIQLLHWTVCDLARRNSFGLP